MYYVKVSDGSIHGPFADGDDQSTYQNSSYHPCSSLGAAQDVAEQIISALASGGGGGGGGGVTIKASILNTTGAPGSGSYGGSGVVILPDIPFQDDIPLIIPGNGGLGSGTFQLPLDGSYTLTVLVLINTISSDGGVMPAPVGTNACEQTMDLRLGDLKLGQVSSVCDWSQMFPAPPVMTLSVPLTHTHLSLSVGSDIQLHYTVFDTAIGAFRPVVGSMALFMLIEQYT